MESKKGVSVFVKLFVAFHVIGITVWALPNPRPAVMNESVEPWGTDWFLYYNWQLKNTPIKYYSISVGNWQYWDMFAPNPANTDIWGDAEVTYQDGTVKDYVYTRIYDLPLHSKYVRERFRKFFERVGDGRFAFLWKPFSERIALEMDTMPGNPPVQVVLRKHYQKLRGPGKEPDPYVTERFYVHQVDQERLKQMKEIP